MNSNVVVRFPIEKVMSRERVIELIGDIKVFQYPGSRVSNPDAWVEKWLKTRSVLSGWRCVQDSLVKSFRMSRARHVVAWARPNSGRPTVGMLCCVESHPVFNWRSTVRMARPPVLLLTPGQELYFRLCKNCEKKMLAMVSVDGDG